MTKVREIKRVLRGFTSVANRVFFYQPERFDIMRKTRQHQDKAKINSFDLQESVHEFKPLYRRTS